MNFKVFSKSIMGYSHWKSNRIMEDYSGFYKDLNQNILISVVADGHGDPRCCRSHIGSKLAVEIVLEQLNKFSQLLISNSNISIENLQDSLYEIFSNNIIKGWKVRCFEHYKENTISDVEKDLFCKDFETDYEPILMYGTTVIAALLYENHLIVLQQGDGNVVVLYKNGNIDMPIALDSRCRKNITTSLCDVDAENSFSLSIFDLEKDSIIACFIATDGIINSFKTTEEMYDFYTGVANLLSKGQIIKDECLLSLSEKGSQDDISIGCIYDETLLNQFIVCKKEAYEIKKQAWELKNKNDKEAYICSIQLKIDERKDRLNKLNKQLIELKKKKPNDVSSITEEIKKDLMQLKQENNYKVYFDGSVGLHSKDRRKFYYQKIRENMISHFDFEFKKYDLFFSRMLNYDAESYQKINDFIKDVESYILEIKVEETFEDSFSDLRKLIRVQKSEVQSELSQLEKKLGSYQSCKEYQDFKNEYELFRKTLKEF